MSRVDVPTLKCDRCGDTTQDTGLMRSFRKLTRHHMSGKEEWDLCPLCWHLFIKWVKNDPGN